MPLLRASSSKKTLSTSVLVMTILLALYVMSVRLGFMGQNDFHAKEIQQMVRFVESLEFVMMAFMAMEAAIVRMLTLNPLCSVNQCLKSYCIRKKKILHGDSLFSYS